MEELDKELEDELYAAPIIRLLEEQMDIMVKGGGFAQLAVKQKSGRGVCEECHTAYANYREHLMRHYLWARGEVDKLGGMPEKPPLPRLLRRPKFKLPPVLSEAQTTASLQRYVREIEAKAKKLVDDGKVKSQYEKVGEVACPEVNDELVGKHIEYVWPMSGAVRMCAYSGTIVSVKKHDTNPAGVTAHNKKKKGKGRGKAKGKQEEREIPVNYTASAMVRWHEEASSKADQQQRCFLLPEKYNSAAVDGWRVYDKGELEPPATTEDETLTEQLDRLAFEAEFFFVKAEK